MAIDERELMAWGAIEREYKKGEIVFLEGHEARFYFQILIGQVRIFNITNDGKEFTQAFFQDGQSFGEPPLFIDRPYPASCIALCDTKILKIPAPVFLAKFDEHPELFKPMIKLFAYRMFDKAETAREIINNDPERRIIGFLRAMKMYHSESPNIELQLVPYTRQEIANFIGLRVETVIRTLIKMNKKGLVKIENRKLYY
jgi:CRP-like cAMP-binding protein